MNPLTNYTFASPWWLLALLAALLLSVAGVLTLDGQMFIESKQDQQVRLTDGNTVHVDQIILGGLGMAAFMGGSSLNAQLTATDIAVVLSTERGAGAASRRWLTSQASVGGASLQAGVDVVINSAALEVNRVLAANGDAFGAIGPVIDWNGADNTGSTAIALTP